MPFVCEDSQSKTHTLVALKKIGLGGVFKANSRGYHPLPEKESLRNEKRSAHAAVFPNGSISGFFKCSCEDARAHVFTC